MGRGAVFTAPLDGARVAALELRRGGRVSIRGTALDVLCRAAFDGRAPTTSAEGGRVTIEYPRFSLAALLHNRGRSAEIELTTALPWSVVVDGGIRESSLDLSALELTWLELRGGAADLRLALPRPRGRIRVRIDGGASRVTLLRPAGVAVVLRLGGGASRLAFDGERYGAIGGATVLETTPTGPQHDGYEIELAGGASELTVAQAAGGR